MAWPTPPLDCEVSLALGADPNADPSTWTWTALSASVYARDGVRITRGRRDEQSLAVPSTCNLTFDNRTGDFSPRNPLGAYYGTIGRNTPLRVRVRADSGDAYSTRFVGFVSEWPQRWNPRGSDFWVPIRADGVLRRLGQGRAPVKSVLLRTILDAEPETYWPLEDGVEATSAGSAVAAPPMNTQGTITFGAITDLPGAFSAPDVTEGALFGLAIGVSATSWYAEFLIKTPFLSGMIARVYVDGPTIGVIRFGVPALSGGFVNLLVEDPTGSVTLATLEGTAVSADWENQWHHIGITMAQNGANIDVELFADGASEDTASFAGTLGRPIKFWANHNFATFSATSFAHVVLGSGTTLSGAAGAMDGLAGEAAATRFARLCAEESIAADVAAGDTEAMGPQTTQTLMGLLRECEAAAEGLLVERLSGDLGFDPPSKRYNQAVALTLDYDSGHIAPALEPTDDDQLTRNDVTVTRSGGSSATSVDQTGPLGVDTVGRYDDPATLNIASDARLPDHASWQVHLGTVDEMRWPRILTNLRRNHALVAAWLACDIGSRIELTNLPDLVSYDPADLLIEGYGEFMDPVTWDVELNCAPAEPYNIAEVEHATLSILGSDSATTAEALDTTETGVDITCGAGPDWVHEADFDIMVHPAGAPGGERMTVTAVAAMAGTFPSRTTTLTVTRSVNGVVKSHSSGAVITFHRPAHIGL